MKIILDTYDLKASDIVVFDTIDRSETHKPDDIVIIEDITKYSHFLHTPRRSIAYPFSHTDKTPQTGVTILDRSKTNVVIINYKKRKQI